MLELTLDSLPFSLCSKFKMGFPAAVKLNSYFMKPSLLIPRNLIIIIVFITFIIKMAFNAINQFQNNIRQRFQVNPLPPTQELNEVWEWNDDGIPIFQDPERQNARHLPATLLESNFAHTETGRQYVNWMQQHQQHNQPFLVNCRGQKKTCVITKSLLRWVYQSDVKKILAENHVDGIQFTKLDYNNPLIDFDPSGGEYPLMNITSSGKAYETSINDINLNALRGRAGPGTYPCRYGNCKKTGPCTSQTAVVRWGPEPGQSINLNRRYTCNANDLVYLIHCDACLQEGNWTTYVGESEKFRVQVGGVQPKNFHDRLSDHLGQLQNRENRTRYPVDNNFSDIVLGIVDGNADPYQLLRDPFVHFNYLHTPEDRRITVLETGFQDRRDRVRAEHLWQIQCGNYQYNAVTFTGSLNK